MTEENQSFEENEQSTLNGERGSEEADGFDSLFADDESQEDAPVTRKEFNELVKGIKKQSSILGQLKSQPKEEARQSGQEVSLTNPVLKTLYFNANPEAKEVWEMVEKDAKALDKDPFELYESTSGYKLEAKSIMSAKSEEELNVSKVSKPSQGGAGVNRAFANIDLSSKKDVEWLNQKPGRRKEYMDWYAKH